MQKLNVPLQYQNAQDMNTQNTIKAGQILTANCIGDSEIKFRCSVLDRKGKFVTIKEMGIERRVMVRCDDRGEYIQPDKYSFAAIYRP